MSFAKFIQTYERLDKPWCYRVAALLLKKMMRIELCAISPWYKKKQESSVEK